MGIFSAIMAKIGFGDDEKDEVAAVAAKATEAVDAPVETVTAAVESIPSAVAQEPALALAPAPAPANSVDVVAKLEELASNNSQQLNWKTSIVDLLKLLGLDSSFGVRKELAAELGCPEEKMADSAQMNMWLHKTVLQKLADNGGNIPADLLN